MPFETVALDFIVKLPVSQGFDSILTITDQGCTKAAIFISCNEDITAEETAALYIKHVFAHFGLPTKVISDRDPQFMSKFMQAACKVMGVKHTPSMAYHPRTDRQSEHSNQWLETAIRFITVTNLQGPPSERTPEEKLWDFKTRAQQYARDWGSCDDVRISYLEFLETEAEDDLALARMIAG
jgi:hypothetical protein